MDGIRKIEDPKLDKNLVADLSTRQEQVSAWINTRVQSVPAHRSQRYKYAAGSDQLRKARGRARCQLEV